MNFELFLQTLGYMAQGMLGIMFVMGLIALVIGGLGKAFKEKENK